MDARATGQGKDITAGSSKKSAGPACAYGLLNLDHPN
jgi:hypothetical protein